MIDGLVCGLIHLMCIARAFAGGSSGAIFAVFEVRKLQPFSHARRRFIRTSYTRGCGRKCTGPQMGLELLAKVRQGHWEVGSLEARLGESVITKRSKE